MAKSKLASVLRIALTATFVLLSAVTSADEPESRRFGRLPWWRDNSNQRNAPNVQNAFKEVVADATQATVEVLCNDRRAALGAIVDSSGLILTKASELTDNVSCKLKSGEVYKAELVATTKAFDLALLKVEAAELPVVQWQKAEPTVGSWLATPGISDVPQSIGVVSVDARRIPEQRGMLGVRLDDPPDGAAGALILDVVDRSAADKAGLREGDRVTHLDGNAIEGGYRGFMSKMANKKAAEVVNLKVAREGEEVDVKVVLMPLPALQRNMETEIEVDGRLSVNRWGFDRIIQHDSFLLPQDCGGPIVNLNGEAIGINIARAARVASYAVPAADVIKFIDEYREGKHLVSTTATPAK